MLEAAGSVLTNKYAEGYPGKRYYGGCQYVDIVEQLAIDRAKKLFGCGFANVQPNSGTQANQGVFNALAEPGDTILGLSLAAGGHLTHGSPVNQSGKWFKPVSLHGACPTRTASTWTRCASSPSSTSPRIIIAGGSAYPRQIDFAAFRAIADEVGAYLMVDMAHFAGLVAGGQHPEPVPACARRHHDDAQDAARPARRHDPDQRRGHRQEDQLGDLPRHPGRPADARHRRQGGGLRRGAAPEFKVYAKNVIDNAKAMGEVLVNAGFALVSGGTDTHLILRRPAAEEADRQHLREGAGARAHHLQQERRAVRPGEADGHLGRPPRRAGRHDARLRRRRVPEIGRMIAEVLDGLAKNGEEGNGAVEAKVKAEATDALQALPDLLLIASYQHRRGALGIS